MCKVELCNIKTKPDHKTRLAVCLLHTLLSPVTSYVVIALLDEMTLIISVFLQFYYDVSKYGYLFIYPVGDFLGFLAL